MVTLGSLTNSKKNCFSNIYNDVNKLLVNRLNNAAYVTPRVRQEIEQTLLAIADIKKVRNSYINS
nr:hypothetical protein [Nostoc sp. DedQUE03]